MARETLFLVAGKWTASEKTYPIVEPFTGKTVAEVFQAGRRDAEDAIGKSVKAFKETQRLSGRERSEALEGISRALKEKKKEFAKTIMLEAGKPITLAMGEVGRAIATFRDGAEEAKRISGELLPLDSEEKGEGTFSFYKRFPVGPVSAITPFNFPLNLVAHKLAPAMAAGNPVILKPAERTPLSSLLLAGEVLETGWPKEALSVLTLHRQDAAPLVEDERIKLLSFTGSAVGWELKQRAGKKKVVLELGGNAPAIVCGDADLKDAAKKIALGAYSYAGQSCISVQRILVQEKVFEPFKKEFLGEVKGLRVGSPAEAETQVGPVIDGENADRIMQWIDEAVSGGAMVLIGNKREGNIIWPTVLENVKKTSKCYCLEVFGPLSVLAPFEGLEDALEEANSSPYGLQAGIFTSSLAAAFKAFHGLEFGSVIINNTPTFRADSQPYGGVKDSGIGREGVRFAVEEMTEVRAGIIDLKKGRKK